MPCDEFGIVRKASRSRRFILSIYAHIIRIALWTLLVVLIDTAANLEAALEDLDALMMIEVPIFVQCYRNLEYSTITNKTILRRDWLLGRKLRSFAYYCIVFLRSSIPSPFPPGVEMPFLPS